MRMPTVELENKAGPAATRNVTEEEKRLEHRWLGWLGCLLSTSAGHWYLSQQEAQEHHDTSPNMPLACARQSFDWLNTDRGVRRHGWRPLQSQQRWQNQIVRSYEIKNCIILLVDTSSGNAFWVFHQRATLLLGPSTSLLQYAGRRVGLHGYFFFKLVECVFKILERDASKFCSDLEVSRFLDTKILKILNGCMWLRLASLNNIACLWGYSVWTLSSWL